jgi:hypothetical protein
MFLASIRESWQMIKPALEQLWLDDNQRGLPDWIPEDIYAACLNKQAFLYLTPEQDGFVILREEAALDGKRELLVWFAYSMKNNNAIDSHKDWVDQMARTIQADRVVFYSTRPGYHRVASKMGYQFQYSKFVREL